MRKNFLLMLALAFGPVLPAQNIITLTGSAQMHMEAGALVSFDKLVLLPSSPYVLVGNNGISRLDLPLHPGLSSSILQSFVFDAPAPPFSGNVTIYYFDGQLNGLTESGLQLQGYNGTSWHTVGIPAARDTVLNFVTTASISGVSFWELTLGRPSPSLPVVYGNLNASCHNNQPLLRWSTSGERNTLRFEIERSADARSWQYAGSVAAAGNASGMRLYTFTDGGYGNFYRIVQVDADGKRTYGTVLRSGCAAGGGMQVVPNPVVDNKAQLVLYAPRAGRGFVQVCDATGREIYSVSVALLEGQNVVPLTVDELPAGWYGVRFRFGERVEQSSFLRTR